MTPDTCPQQPPHDILWWCGECGYLDPNAPTPPEFWDWEDAARFAICRAAVTGLRHSVRQKSGVERTFGPWTYWVVTEAVPEELRAAS